MGRAGGLLQALVAGQLFRPFVTTKSQGTGLGLWISRSLLERYGGELQAARRPAADGPGAVFTIVLPTNGGADARPPPQTGGSDPSSRSVRL